KVVVGMLRGLISMKACTNVPLQGLDLRKSNLVPDGRTNDECAEHLIRYREVEQRAPERLEHGAREAFGDAPAQEHEAAHARPERRESAGGGEEAEDAHVEEALQPYRLQHP